jgi:hypothetical protein
MASTSVIRMEARNPSAVSPSVADHVLKFISGALFTAALVACGAALVIVALTLGVVGAPVIAIGLGVWAIRRRERPVLVRVA